MNHIINHAFRYETEKLIRAFFPFEQINTSEIPDGDERYIVSSEDADAESARLFAEICLSGNRLSAEETVTRGGAGDYEWLTLRERKLAALIFGLLVKETGYRPPWGILTGIRPSKLMSGFCRDFGEKEALRRFTEDYLVSEEKAALALTVAKNEQRIMNASGPDSYSLYVSIPFCPSRCSYCSFVSASNEQAKKLIPEYVLKLERELEYTAEIADALSLRLKSIYIGGGTPTALSASQLKAVTDAVKKHFHPGKEVEYTVEAGRPDSIDEEKLNVIKDCGAERISVNPQTFNDDVLRAIGRRHSAGQTVSAVEAARRAGFESINMDLIAGLPGESFESFAASVEKTLSLRPENITVHTLSVKRSSSLSDDGNVFFAANEAVRMLAFASKRLTESGYKPYYMYRQSKCLGNLENVGWSLPGHECEYNVQMMEETHTVLAAGAGAVSKLKNSKRIERIFNFKYPFEYIAQFDEILGRKSRIAEFYAEDRQN